MGSFLSNPDAVRFYEASIEHRNSHKCGSFPFANGPFLNSIVRIIGAERVLEIGTGIGYSAFCFALGNDVHVDTIDMVEEHKSLAEESWHNLDVHEQIECIVGNSQEILPNLISKNNIVFFDGFAPIPDEVGQYVRLLEADGIIVTTNLSWNDSSGEYLSNIESLGLETILFDDTSISSRNRDVLRKSEGCWVDLFEDTKKS